MSDFSATAASLANIEAQQDDLLLQLDALEKRLERVLADYAATVASPGRLTVASPGQIATPGVMATPPPPVATEGLGVVLPFPAAAVTTLGTAALMGTAASTGTSMAAG